jgi:hypothetical protein
MNTTLSLQLTLLALHARYALQEDLAQNPESVSRQTLAFLEQHNH